jgi:hypothetical protein
LYPALIDKKKHVQPSEGVPFYEIADELTHLQKWNVENNAQGIDVRLSPRMQELNAGQSLGWTRTTMMRRSGRQAGRQARGITRKAYLYREA